MGFKVKVLKQKLEVKVSSDMPPTNFTGADFTGANLGGVSLRWCDSSATPPCLMEKSTIQVVKIKVYNRSHLADQMI